MTASNLPPAKTRFCDNNGGPLSGGKVYSYVPETSSFKATWQDAAQTTLNANPLTLDGRGEALMYGSGSYRQVVKDAGGNTIWDQVVSSLPGGDLEGLTTGRLYWDQNGDTEDRLVIDPGGLGSTISPDVYAPGGASHAVVMLQNEVGYVDASAQRFWNSFVFRDWDGDLSTKPTSKRSRFAFSIQTRSELNAPYWTQRPIPKPGDKDYAAYQALIAGGGDYDDWNEGWTARYLPQEVGPLSLTAVCATNVQNGKVEGLVVSAREEAPIADGDVSHPAKGVAVQAITVRVTQGPIADDKNQFEAAEDSPDDGTGDDGNGPPGTVNGSFTIRINGGTTNQSAEYFRSWSAVLAGGRAGFLNGIALGKLHHSEDDTLDGDGIAGTGGVWGGRSFWHQDTFAVYCKDTCPGWVTIGADGVAEDNLSSIANAPVDITVDLTDTDIDFNGAKGGAVVKFNGVKLLGARSTGWTAMTGTPSKAALAATAAGTVSASYVQAEAQASRNRIAALEARLAAYDAALIAHGLIGA